MNLSCDTVLFDSLLYGIDLKIVNINVLDLRVWLIIVLNDFFDFMDIILDNYLSRNWDFDSDDLLGRWYKNWSFHYLSDTC